MAGVTTRLQEAFEQASKLSPEEQDELAEALLSQLEWDRNFGLTPEQVEEVKRRQAEFQRGESRMATDEEVAEMWKKFGV